MKRYSFKSLMVLLAVVAVSLSSCKKSESSTDDVVSAQDHTTVSQHLNASIDDASNAAGGVGTMAGKTDGFATIAGATINYSDTSHGIVTITYDGTTVVDGYFRRSGVVTITLVNYPTVHWRDAGAQLDLNFDNVQVTNAFTGGQFKYNGIHHIVNMTGGLAYQLMNGTMTGTVKHHHTATGLTVTLANGATRQWNVDRIREYNNTGLANGISMSVYSGNPAGQQANVDAWGTNRNGESFYNQILTPIVFNNSCGNYRQPNSGEVKHVVSNRTLDVLLGVDQSGTAVSSTSCPYGYKVTYTQNSHTYTRIVQYWH